MVSYKLYKRTLKSSEEINDGEKKKGKSIGNWKHCSSNLNTSSIPNRMSSIVDNHEYPPMVFEHRSIHLYVLGRLSVV